MKTTAPTATPDVDGGQLFPGQDIKWGLSFLINPQEGGKERRQPVVGRAGQYVFLGRSVEARRRCYPDADPAVRGSSCPWPIRQVRERHVQGAIVGLVVSHHRRVRSSRSGRGVHGHSRPGQLGSSDKVSEISALCLDSGATADILHRARRNVAKQPDEVRSCIRAPEGGCDGAKSALARKPPSVPRR